jgi:hypothetical protein
MRAILADEERRGRVEREGDRWRLISESFPPALLAAVAALDGVGRGLSLAGEKH